MATQGTVRRPSRPPPDGAAARWSQRRRRRRSRSRCDQAADKAVVRQLRKQRAVGAVRARAHDPPSASRRGKPRRRRCEMAVTPPPSDRWHRSQPRGGTQRQPTSSRPASNRHRLPGSRCPPNAAPGALAASTRFRSCGYCKRASPVFQVKRLFSVDKGAKLTTGVGRSTRHEGYSGTSHSRSRNPDARATGRATASRIVASRPTSTRRSCARVTAV